MALTNVSRFGSTYQSTGGGTTVTYTLPNAVSAGDLVIIQVAITNENNTNLVDSLGNTLNNRQSIADATYGPFRAYDCIVTTPGTMTLTVTAAGTFRNVSVIGQHWTGATFTYDQSAQNNATNTGQGTQFTDQYTASLTLGGQRLVFGMLGSTGVINNASPTLDVGWGSANGATTGGSGNAGNVVGDIVAAAGSIQMHARYASFSYAGGVTMAYSYVEGGGGGGTPVTGSFPPFGRSRHGPPRRPPFFTSPMQAIGQQRGARVFSIGVSDSAAAPTDSPTRSFVGARSIATSISAATEAPTRASVQARGVSESDGAPTDAVTRSVSYPRAAADSVAAPTETPTRAAVQARSIANTAGASEAPTRATNQTRSSADAVAIVTEVATRLLAYSRSVADSISAPSETDSRAAVFARSAADTAGASDSPSRVLVLARSIANSVAAVTEATTRAAQYFRGAGDSTSAPTDVVSYESTGHMSRSTSDSVAAPTDSPARSYIGARAVSDSKAAPTDATTRAGQFFRGVTDAVAAVSASPQRGLAGNRTAADSVAAATDLVARAFVGARAIANSVAAVTEAATRATVLARSRSEAAGASDSVSRQANYTRSPSENLSLSEVIARTATYLRGISNSTAAPTDQAARTAVLARAISDSILKVSESVSIVFVPFAITRNVFESVGAPTDQLTRLVIYARSIAISIGAPVDVVIRELSRVSSGIMTPRMSATGGKTLPNLKATIGSDAIPATKAFRSPVIWPFIKKKGS